MLSGSELWLLRLMADRGLALLDAGTLLMVIEERGELRVAASSGEETVRLRIMPVEGSALGDALPAGQAGVAGSPARPGGGVAARTRPGGARRAGRAAEHGGPRRRPRDRAALADGGFKGPDRQALNAFATSVAQRLAAERSVEIERLRYGMEARERERTRWAREIHDETHPGPRRAAPEAGQRARPRRAGVAQRGRGRGARRPGR